MDLGGHNMASITHMKNAPNAGAVLPGAPESEVRL